MAEDPKAQEAGVIRIDQAASLLMISTERVRQLMRAGYIKRGKRAGTVALVAAVQGYIGFLKDEEKRSTKTAADSRVRDARAKEIEIRVAERERTLIPFEDAVAALDVVVSKVRTEVIGIPARMTRDISLRRKIETEVDGSLSRIADALTEATDALASGRDVLAAEQEGPA
jgi:uncharacterized coiled-coil protein SlyX